MFNLGDDIVEDLSFLNELDVNKFYLEDDNGKKKYFKSKYTHRLMYMKPEIKKYYSIIKNKYLSYGIKNRITNRCEYFNYKGIVGRVEVRGNSLKLFLPLDTAFLEEKRYHLKDYSSKPKYYQTPLMIRLKSNRSILRALELIEIIFDYKNRREKKYYKDHDYVRDLIPSGEAIIARLGFKDEYIRKSININNVTKDFPSNLDKYLPRIYKDEEEDIVAQITLDTLCLHFNEGEIISLEVLKEKNIIPRGNYLKIKARGNLSKRLIIIADEFEDVALSMLLQTNSVAVLVNRK